MSKSKAKMDSSKLIERYLKKMRKVQNVLLESINDSKEKEMQDIFVFLDGIKICDNRDEFKSFLHLLSILYENHHQNLESMTLIEKLIIHYKDYIQNSFPNCEIFKIFDNDKKLLLFFIQSKIIKIDKSVENWLSEDKYQRFFYQEIKDNLKAYTKKSILKEMPDDYLFKREKGENESYLCKIIRKDSIDDFISYVAKTNISLNIEINDSIFETNTFLIGKTPTLIEYSAFYGSMQIFKYLQLNKVELTESIWPFAIHSQNNEILSILEDKNIKPNKKNAMKYYKEAIKCHHNDIANYIQENYIGENEEEDKNELKILETVYFKYYNFEFIKPELIDKSLFIKLCGYDYPIFVDLLMKTEDIDVNSIITKKKDVTPENNKSHLLLLTEKSALSTAVVNNNTSVAKILLENNDIDVNHNYSVSYLYDDGDDIKVPILIGAFSISLYLILASFLLHKFETSVFSFFVIVLTLAFLLFVAGFEEAFKIPMSIRMLLKIRPISSRSFKLIYEESAILYWVCFNNNIELVKILMTKKNIDVNAKYKNIFGLESNALNISTCNEEIVKCLLANPNIDVNIKFKYNYPRELNCSFVFMSLIFLMLFYHLIVLLSVIIFFFYLILIDYLKQLSLIKKVFVRLGGVVSFLIIVYKCVCYPSYITTFFWDTLYICIMINNNLYIFRRILIFLNITEFLSTLLYTYTYEITPLLDAIKNNYTETAKLLLSNDKINVSSLFILRNYDQFGDEDDYNDDSNISILSLKLKKDEYITKTALNIAAQKGNTEIVKLLLLNNKTNVGAKCKTTTYYRTIKFSNMWIGLYIIESIVTSMFSRFSAKSSLIIAAENSNVDIVKQLLEKSSIKSVKYDYQELKQDKINKSTRRNGKNDKTKNNNKYNGEKFDEILELLQNFINGNKLK